MAQYDISKQVKELAEIGVTWHMIEDEIQGHHVDHMGGDEYIAWGRKGELAFDRYYDRKIAEAATPKTAPAGGATEKQINYIVKLLARRAFLGQGGGFMGTRRFYIGDTVDRNEVATLSKAEASALIDSLTENY